MKNYKKITSLILSLVFTVNMISCSEKKDESQKSGEVQSFVAENISTKAYKRSNLEQIPKELTAIYCLEPYNSREKFLILGGTLEKTPVFYTADKGLQNFTPFEIPDFPIGTCYDIDVAEDGTIVEVVVDVDYGDLPEPDIYAEDYDAELYESVAEYGIFVNCFSIDGDLISSSEITDIYDFVSPEIALITGLTCSSNGESCIVTINTKNYVIGTDGSFKGELPKESGMKDIFRFGKNSSGDVMCAIEYETDGEVKIFKVDMETGKLEDSKVTYTFPDGIKGEIIEGSGEYSMYVLSNSVVYGIKSSDNSLVPLFDIKSAGLSVVGMGDFYFDENGNFVSVQTDYSKAKVKVVTYIECDPEEIANMPVITVATTYDSIFLNEYIANFNDSQTEYRVEVKDYSEYATEDNIFGDQEKLALDIISGESPDVFMGDFIEEYELDEKGAVVDLYEFMENDEEVNKENLVPSVARAFETDGHLYQLPNSFSFTMPMVKTKFANGKDIWTTEDYINAVKNLPDDMGLQSFKGNDVLTKHSVYNFILQMEEFIAEDNLTCSFDSEKYIKVLETSNEFPLEEEYLNEYDFENMTPEEHSRFSYDYSMAFVNEKALYNDCIIGWYSNYLQEIKGTFGGEDVTVIKEPELLSFDSFAISARSDNKDFAWDFVRQFFTDEFYQDEDNNTLINGFPVTKTGLEYEAKEVQKPKEYSETDYTGDYFHNGTDEPIEIGLMTDEDIDKVNEIIDNLKPTRDFDYQVRNIIYEESNCYFNGDCTAEECADATQNRVSIYLAENQ